MGIKLIAQAILFILQNVEWKSPGPSMSEYNLHVRNMEMLGNYMEKIAR